MFAGLAVLAAGGGISAVVVTGHHGMRPAAHPKAAATKRTIRSAHGLMLFPLVDPDAHVHNGAESIDTAR